MLLQNCLKNQKKLTVLDSRKKDPIYDTVNILKGWALRLKNSKNVTTRNFTNTYFFWKGKSENYLFYILWVNYKYLSTVASVHLLRVADYGM